MIALIKNTLMSKQIATTFIIAIYFIALTCLINWI